MALVPPVILPNSDALLNDGAVMTVATKDLNFEFNDILDPLTIANGIRLTRSGKDGVFDPPGTTGSNDVVIVPGFIGLNDDARQVVMRFSTPLPDDVYRIEIIGAALRRCAILLAAPSMAGSIIRSISGWTSVPRSLLWFRSRCAETRRPASWK